MYVCTLQYLLMAVTPMLATLLDTFFGSEGFAHLDCEQAVLAPLLKVEMLPLRRHASVPWLGSLLLLSCLSETCFTRKNLMTEPIQTLYHCLDAVAPCIM